MRTFNNKFHIWEYKTLYIDDSVKAIKYIKILENQEKQLFGIDIETAKLPKYVEHERAGLCPILSTIRLLQIYDGESTVYVFDLWKCPLYMFKTILKKGRYVGHNSVFEIKHLMHGGVDGLNMGCSMLVSQLVYAAEHSDFTPYRLPFETDDDNTDQTGLSKYKRLSHSLEACIQREFGVKPDKSQQVSDWGKPELEEDQIMYAGLDAVLTYKLAIKLSTRLKNHKLIKIYQLQKEMQHVVARMELNGIPVDWEYHSELVKKWNVASEAALKKCKPFFGEVNMRSGKQMNEWLKGYLVDQPLVYASWPRTDKCKCSTPMQQKPCTCGAPCTFNKSQIAAFKDLPAIKVLLEYKKYATLLATFGESLAAQRHPVTSRLHTSYTLGFTATGRLSSRSPNLQNMPHDEEFRNMFRAEKDFVLVVADFSQIELRLQAEFSKDKFMCQIFREGKDFYETMASAVLGYEIKPLKEKDYDKWKALRNSAGKVPALALAYGMGSKKLARYALGLGINQPQSFWDKAYKAYYALVPDYIKWCDKMRKRADQLGYIETLYGKRRKLATQEVYTAAPNTVIQGSAAELMEESMLRCERQLTIANLKLSNTSTCKPIQMVATVHDELALHCHKSVAEEASSYLSSSMNNAMKELFKGAVNHHVAEAGYGERWGTIKAGL